jgi:hypothetical protein
MSPPRSTYERQPAVHCHVSFGRGNKPWHIEDRARGRGDGSDSGAAAISIDLQTSGTAAQGLFMTSTDATPSGNWIMVRANSRDDFVVKSAGKVGIGMGIGSTPAGRLEISQVDDNTVGLAMTANSGSAQQLVLLKGSGGNARFEVNASGNAVLRATAFLRPTCRCSARRRQWVEGTESSLSTTEVRPPPPTIPAAGSYTPKREPSIGAAAPALLRRLQQRDLRRRDPGPYCRLVLASAC